jgi:Zn-dependent protease with chaperone function
VQTVILPYLLRLLCLAFASFFLVHLVTAVVIAIFAPLAIRRARRLAPQIASRLLLVLRLAPLGLALFVVVGLCVPSYLWLEPRNIVEPVGFVCLLMAALGGAVCGTVITRAGRAAIRSILFMRGCRRSGRAVHLDAGNPPAWVVEDSRHLLALAGILRPRVVISKDILETLSGEELSVVFRHESAHRNSRDNLKRLCIFLAPGIMPFWNGFWQLEHAWTNFAEYAADESAVAGDARRSLALASSLVRVARHGTAVQLSAGAISFLEDSSELSVRVDRLLRPSSPLESSGSVSWRETGTVLLLAGCLAVILLNSIRFKIVQALLERLIQ